MSRSLAASGQKQTCAMNEAISDKGEQRNLLTQVNAQVHARATPQAPCVLSRADVILHRDIGMDNKRPIMSGSDPSLVGNKVMSALPPKADMCAALAYVCYGPTIFTATAPDKIAPSETRYPARSGGLSYPPRKDGCGIRRLDLLAIASVIQAHKHVVSLIRGTANRVAYDDNAIAQIDCV